MFALQLNNFHKKFIDRFELLNCKLSQCSISTFPTAILSLRSIRKTISKRKRIKHSKQPELCINRNVLMYHSEWKHAPTESEPFKLLKTDPPLYTDEK